MWKCESGRCLPTLLPPHDLWNECCHQPTIGETEAWWVSTDAMLYLRPPECPLEQEERTRGGDWGHCSQRTPVSLLTWQAVSGSQCLCDCGVSGSLGAVGQATE